MIRGIRPRLFRRFITVECATVRVKAYEKKKKEGKKREKWTKPIDFSIGSDKEGLVGRRCDRGRIVLVKMQLKSRVGEIKIVWTSLQVGRLVDIDREFANWSNPANSSLGEDSFGRRRKKKSESICRREFTSILDLANSTSSTC